MSFIYRMRSIRNLALENVRGDKPPVVGFNASLQKVYRVEADPYGVPGVAEANTDVIAWSGVTTTGHQNGKSRHPSVSLPF